MTLHYNLHITEGFFKSRTNQTKDSISEKFAKILISKCIGVNDKDFLIGNPNLHQPDYIYNDIGYEVTFGEDPQTIQLLQGLYFEPNNENARQHLETWITEAVKRKSDKHYCIPTIPVIICLTPDIFWEECFTTTPDALINPMQYITDTIWNGFLSNGRKLFNTLYDKYIKPKKFPNIFIINASLNVNYQYIVYNIKEYIEKNRLCTKFVCTNKALPYFELVKVENDGILFQANHSYNVIYHGNKRQKK